MPHRFLTPEIIVQVCKNTKQDRQFGGVEQLWTINIDDSKTSKHTLNRDFEKKSKAQKSLCPEKPWRKAQATDSTAELFYRNTQGIRSFPEKRTPVLPGPREQGFALCPLLHLLHFGSYR